MIKLNILSEKAIKRLKTKYFLEVRVFLEKLSSVLFFKSPQAVFILVFLFGSCFSFAQSTTRNYDIKAAGIKVGQFSVTCVVGMDGNETYHIKSKVKVNLLFYKTENEFVAYSKFDKQNLSAARVDMKSDKNHYHTDTKKIQTAYQVKGEHQAGEFKRTIWEPIPLTISKLYFVEPRHGQKVFAEYYGDFMTIKKLSEGQYQGKIGENEDHFFYENGILVKTVKKNGFKDLEFVYVDTISKPSR